MCGCRKCNRIINFLLRRENLGSRKDFVWVMIGIVPVCAKFIMRHEYPHQRMEDIMDRVVAVVLGGGRGSRLYPLTHERAKPAVPLFGKYRLIDVTLSNCINSGINRVFLLTQFLSASLHRHIMMAYKFDAFSHGFVEILAAEQTERSQDWFQGTADAVRATLHHIMHFAGS